MMVKVPIHIQHKPAYSPICKLLPSITPSSIPMLVLMASPEPLHGPRPSTLIGSLDPGKSLNDLVIK